MKPYYKDIHNTLYNQDFRENDLPDESVQMVVTSPPYWGLRKYSGEQELIWGVKKNDDGTHELCKHEWKIETARGFCSLCGAWRGAYGLEPTPEMYAQHTIEILREIRRVLRKDGVVFWNIGDSYATHASGGKGYAHNFRPPDVAIREGIDQPKPTAKSIGLKEKDLCLIPFRIAIAAQEDGWWVRSIIIWSKPNPMPESVTDRPTESHEYILMLTKSAKYYWDADAVREANQTTWEEAWQPNAYPDKRTGETQSAMRSTLKGHEKLNSNGRNLRSVWTFPTQPYPEAHFAVFPEKLPELCIKAATPEVGCCSKCGRPWERIIERTGHINKREPAHAPKSEPTKTDSTGWGPATMATDNWQPRCKCDADEVPSVVMDPFAGAGTTLWVAKKLNRKAIGYELSEEYCELAMGRCQQLAMNISA